MKIPIIDETPRRLPRRRRNFRLESFSLLERRNFKKRAQNAVFTRDTLASYSPIDPFMNTRRYSLETVGVGVKERKKEKKKVKRTKENDCKKTGKAKRLRRDLGPRDTDYAHRALWNRSVQATTDTFRRQWADLR